MSLESPSSSTGSAADAGGNARPCAATFHLDGPTRQLDRRVNAVRQDVADVALAGTLFAPHYAAPMMRSCSAPSAMMRAAPQPGAEAVSQILGGEDFAVLDITGDWAWGYAVQDHYVGYVQTSALGDRIVPTHHIAVREALIFAGPSIKAAVIGTLPFGARVSATDSEGFLAIGGGFLHRRHVAAIGSGAGDAVAVAELFLGTPYLWGGRGAGGIDCSGLVQIALAATGRSVPRDTDQQRTQIGYELAGDELLRRGDMIYFPGHVGLMIDDTQLLHANAHWMSTVIEPLADVVARLIPTCDRPILSRRRLPS